MEKLLLTNFDLRIYMANLRHKLEDNPTQPKYFITELQVGYRLVYSMQVE